MPSVIVEFVQTNQNEPHTTPARDGWGYIVGEQVLTHTTKFQLYGDPLCSKGSFHLIRKGIIVAENKLGLLHAVQIYENYKNS